MLIIRLAGQAPSRRGPLSSNVRPSQTTRMRSQTARSLHMHLRARAVRRHCSPRRWSLSSHGRALAARLQIVAVSLCEHLAARSQHAAAHVQPLRSQLRPVHPRPQQGLARASTIVGHPVNWRQVAHATAPSARVAAHAMSSVSRLGRLCQTLTPNPRSSGLAPAWHLARRQASITRTNGRALRHS